MPKFTNYYGLSEGLASALMHDSYYQPGHISATGLLSPPRIRQLQIRHDNYITEDVSDRIWALLGSAVHYIVEKSDTTQSLSEERLSGIIQPEGYEAWRITGKPDVWTEPAKIVDYKVTSAWVGVYGIRDDWIAQLNIYAFLFREAGFPVDELEVEAIFRDWNRNKAMSDRDYPSIPVKRMPVPVWSNDKTLEFIKERVRLHQEAEQLEDRELPFCTPEERWERPGKYAVMKKGRKSAVRLFDTEQEAEAMLHTLDGKHYLEVRPGQSIRCERFCNVSGFCNYAKQQEA